MGFSEQLRKARLSRGYTQQQVADLMGITKSTYCGYETGKREPDVPKIKKLAEILGTSGDMLLETGYEPKENAVVKKFGPETEAILNSIVQRLEGMSSAKLKEADRYITFLEQNEKTD